MATLVLSSVGAAVGGALLPSGIGVFGATVAGATIGSQIGALAGSYVDQTLFGSSGQGRVVEGPRLSDVRVTTSSEGAGLPKIYGRARLSGQIIWATNFEEEIVRTQEGGGGGKGLGQSSKSTATTTRNEYRYFGNFAIALCEGEISQIARVWADGKELDLSEFNYRVYQGTETQQPDSLIEALEGAGNAPAFRGTAYIVFERMALARFGNRIPQLSFEIVRAIDEFESSIKAINMLPGSGEFVYDPTPVLKDLGGGVTQSENTHTRLGGTDWNVSLDQLQDVLPNAKSVSLIVSWFGSDLRVGQCNLRPGVEISEKVTTPYLWEVAGLGRSDADLVSLDDGAPAYGGTPSDFSVISAISDLKSRGKKVTFYPFILMDVPDGNSLEDPYTGGAAQPSYPWRGRITVDPAPGRSGSPDKTPGAAVQLASFLGQAAPSDFSIVGGKVLYSGPNEWSFRRMVLHNAHLCLAAGGVEAFIIGSELRGVTQIRDGQSSYPFVNALIQLAGDVKSVLGPGTQVTYAADWSEYFGHQPQDGSEDVYFHLDPLWSSSHIDAIGIDNYWPLADWREGNSHLDLLAGAESIFDLGYLKGNIAGGEGYDWYYASGSDRDAQLRIPITDGGGKPWLFRFKDIKSWWSNAHFNRPGGVEEGVATSWVPESKPIWFTEIGCPAVDKGANQPNVFVDPKSSESNLPYYSRGVRNDYMQRRYLQAIIEYYDLDHEDYVAGSNPISSVYGGAMVDLDNLYCYAWDARPYPAFPTDDSVWGDAANWQLGHWLSGRMARAPLARIVRAVLDDFGFYDYDVGSLNGVISGFVIDRIMSARDALQPLELAFFVDSYESSGQIKFVHRGVSTTGVKLNADDLVLVEGQAELFSLRRAQETELPNVAKISYISDEGEYRQSVASSRRLSGKSGRVANAQLPLIMGHGQAQALADSWLFDAWSARESGEFGLPPSMMALEPSDNIVVDVGGRERLLRIVEIGENISRDIRALSIDPNVFNLVDAPERPVRLPRAVVFGVPDVAFLDLPLLGGNEDANAGYIAAYQSPWPGSVAFYRSPDISGFQLNQLADSPAVMGKTLVDLSSHDSGRWDHGAGLEVELSSSELSSYTDLQIFDGRNIAAIENPNGDYEVLQFRGATLIGERTYALDGLLRGQAGSESAMGNPVPAGARFVLLDGAVRQVDMVLDDVGRAFNWTFGPGNRDIGDASFGTKVQTFNGVGLRPLSPVHIRGQRSGNDLDISWIRRTRIGGDSWEQVEVPLEEAIEAYEVDVFDGGTVKRTLISTTTDVAYSEADQISDWGSVQSSYEVAVYQMSGILGRGSAGRASV